MLGCDIEERKEVFYSTLLLILGGSPRPCDPVPKQRKQNSQLPISFFSFFFFLKKSPRCPLLPVLHLNLDRLLLGQLRFGRAALLPLSLLLSLERSIVSLRST